MISEAEYHFLLGRDLMSFTERAFYELHPGRNFQSASFIELIAARLEACARGEIKRLIINLPPRSLKSHCASVAFPAWYLGRYPGRHVICASYGQDLSDKFGRDCRSVMNSGWYKRVFKTRLSDRQAVHDFATTDQGTRLATSIGGVLTGRGADLIIIDDPLKPDDALSETKRNSANDWNDNTLLSRLNDKDNGCIVVVMQRLHQDDLVGHLLSQGPWEVLSFSAIAEEPECTRFQTNFGTCEFVREMGSPLHPERESLETLKTIRRTMGEYNFSSQYQQMPIPVGGAVIKTGWLRYYEEGKQPRFRRIVQSWDTAHKAGELNSYSVCTTWGVADKNYFLLDVLRKRLNYPELKRAVIEQADRFRPSAVLIEDKASGIPLIQDLSNQVRYHIVPFTPVPGMDKLIRLHTNSAPFEHGRVFLPRNAWWLADYVHELTTFPGTKYDDQVDSTTQALAYLSEPDEIEIWLQAFGGRSLPVGTLGDNHFGNAGCFIPARGCFTPRWV